MAKMILSIKFERLIDTDPDLSFPDLSFLGEYSDKAKSDLAIDREAQGDMGRNEFRYFNPTNAENKKQAQQDYDRAETYNKGDWCMLGIRAEAQITLGSNIVQSITSGGLWGLESDNDKTFFVEEAQNQLNELARELRQLHFSDKAIDKAMKEAPADSIMDVEIKG